MTSEDDLPSVEHRFLADPPPTIALRATIATQELVPAVVVSIYQHNQNSPGWMVRGRADLGMVAFPLNIPMILFVTDIFVDDEEQAWALARKVFRDLHKQRMLMIQRPPTSPPAPPKTGKFGPS
jgi:hypothetical protein